MDLSLLCLFIIVPIHMISRFMIPLAFSFSQHAIGTDVSTSALRNYNFYPVNLSPDGPKDSRGNQIIVLVKT